MLRWLSIALIALGFVLGVFVLGFWGVRLSFLTRGGPGGEPVWITVPPGSTTQSLAKLLATPKLVAEAQGFERYLTTMHPPKVVAPGVYKLIPHRSPIELLEVLEQGHIETASFSVEACDSLSRVADKVVKAGVLTQKTAFLKAAQNRRLAKQLRLEGLSLKNQMKPGVYTVPIGESPERLVRQLASAFQASYAALEAKDAPRASEKPRAPGEVIPVAALIESSGLAAKNRGAFAAVVYNRLAQNWELKSRSLAKAKEAGLDWVECTPSEASLRAALHPDPIDALYMVPQGPNTDYFDFCVDRSCYRDTLRKWRMKPNPEVELP